MRAQAELALRVAHRERRAGVPQEDAVVVPRVTDGQVGHVRRLRDGPITVARFDGDHGQYRLAVGEGRSMKGPYTQNNYVWMKVDDWPRWERTLMEGPFIHHAAIGYGHCAEALIEATKYVPGLKPVVLGM